jgi:PilZ domain
MRTERRRNYRIQWHSRAMISSCDGDWSSPCVLSDFSNGGAKISGPSVRHVPDQFFLRMARGVRPRNCRVLWRSTEAIGVEFTDPIVGAQDMKVGRMASRKRRAALPEKKLKHADETVR